MLHNNLYRLIASLNLFLLQLICASYMKTSPIWLILDSFFFLNNHIEMFSSFVVDSKIWYQV